jgi:hypothetical protein
MYVVSGVMALNRSWKVGRNVELGVLDECDLGGN